MKTNKEYAMPKTKPNTMNLNKTKNSIEFYDDRYCKGYMKEWPVEKKERVLEIIKSLNLPKTGNALDFGCGGNGV